jgi:hypothetical protein
VSDPLWANVILFIYGEGADGSVVFTDHSSVGRVLTANGNAKNDTDKNVFGQSIKFDGNGDYISTPDAVDLRLTAGVTSPANDFCLEGYFYITDLSHDNQLFNKQTAAGSLNDYRFYVNTDAKLVFEIYGAGAQAAGPVSSGPVHVDQVVHLAVSRQGTTVRLFINGFLDGEDTQGGAVGNAGGPLNIGHSARVAGQDFEGWANWLRFTKGAARYTADFIPPSFTPPAVFVPPTPTTELITLRPNTPLGEDWEWYTDRMISDDGTEQRVALSSLPRRVVSGAYAFDDQALLNQHIMTLARAQGRALNTPFFQYETRLTADAALGAGVLSFDARKTQLANSDYALLYDEAESRFELVQVDVVSAASSTLAAPTAQAWPSGSLLSPVHIAYAKNGAVITRKNPDGVATIDLAMREVGFHTPFVNPLNVTALPLLGGFPLLTSCPVGNGDFRDEVVDGSQVTDYGGVVDIRSRWKRTKLAFERSFRCNRILDLADWEWWFKFADNIRGSWRPFWLPSLRQDFSIVVAPVPTGDTLTLAGHFFRDYCFAYLGLRGLFIQTDGGTHYVLATAVADSGDDDAVTFSPALPAGGAYALNQKIGLLYKCRLADDRISWKHYDAVSYASLSILSTDD